MKANHCIEVTNWCLSFPCTSHFSKAFLSLVSLKCKRMLTFSRLPGKRDEICECRIMRMLKISDSWFSKKQRCRLNVKDFVSKVSEAFLSNGLFCPVNMLAYQLAGKIGTLSCGQETKANGNFVDLFQNESNQFRTSCSYIHHGNVLHTQKNYDLANTKSGQFFGKIQETRPIFVTFDTKLLRI